MRVTRFGSISMTLTGMDSPFSANTRVMPALRPIRPIAIVKPLSRSARRSAQADLHVYAGSQIQLHQGVDRLVSRVDDVDEALVGAHFVLVPRVLVDVGGHQHGEPLHTGR